METIAVLLMNLVLLSSTAGVAALLCVMLLDWSLETNEQAAAGRRAAGRAVAAEVLPQARPAVAAPRYSGASGPVLAGATV